VEGAAARASPADSRLADLAGAATVLEQGLEVADLPVGGDQRVELLPHEPVTAFAEAVEVEHEPAGVSQLELAHLAQVTEAAAGPPALADAERRGLLRRAGAWREAAHLLRRRNRDPPAPRRLCAAQAIP